MSLAQKLWKIIVRQFDRLLANNTFLTSVSQNNFSFFNLSKKKKHDELWKPLGNLFYITFIFFPFFVVLNVLPVAMGKTALFIVWIQKGLVSL